MTEHEHATLFADWLRRNNYTFHHSPNETHTKSWSQKRKYWERCLDFGKPFALLLPVNILSDSMIVTTIPNQERELQLLIPDKRMRFFNCLTGETGTTPTFKACYFAVDMFERQIILEDL